MAWECNFHLPVEPQLWLRKKITFGFGHKYSQSFSLLCSNARTEQSSLMSSLLDRKLHIEEAVITSTLSGILNTSFSIG